MKKALKSRQTLKSGFTLVEVLIVCAVISLLVAITMPALRSAKEKGNFAICLNNMHQISLAVQMYMNDHDEVFPPCLDYIPWRQPLTYVEKSPADLAFVLNNYIGYNNGSNTNSMGSKVWVCPTAARYGRKGDDASSPEPYRLGKFNTPAGWGPKYDITYRWNSLTTRDGQSMTGGMEAFMRAHPQSAKSLKQPSKAALLWDLRDDLVWYGLPLHSGYTDRVNCLFVDGHVELVTAVPGAAPVNTLWYYAAYGPGEGWDGITNDPVN
jgi:prepilin-type N-terminal cleavage/methylation domain-containing protein/prepilin-type processing-associated H-X9-DG protein